MKNYKEMAESVFQRSNEIIIEKKQKRKRNIQIGLTVSFCLIVILPGVTFLNNNRLNRGIPNIENISDNNNRTDTHNSNNTSPATLQQGSFDYPIVWADQGTQDSEVQDNAITNWNSKRVGISLYEALENTKEIRIFAIAAHFNYIDPEFIYNGKTLNEYKAEVSKANLEFEKLGQLLKEGEVLKYGVDLYKIGAPDGTKWSQQWYEERLEFYEEDFLAKYIVDGVFLQEKVISDIKSDDILTNAEEAYDAAYLAYINQVYEETQMYLGKLSINCDRPSNENYLIIYATKEEFASLSLENISNWFFSFAVKNSDDAYDLTE